MNFYFWRVERRREFVFIFSYGMINCMRANFGDWVG